MAGILGIRFLSRKIEGGAQVEPRLFHVRGACERCGTRRGMKASSLTPLNLLKPAIGETASGEIIPLWAKRPTPGLNTTGVVDRNGVGDLLRGRDDVRPLFSRDKVFIIRGANEVVATYPRVDLHDGGGEWYDLRTSPYTVRVSVAA